MAHNSIVSVEELKSRGAEELARLLRAQIVENRSLLAEREKLRMDVADLSDLCCYLDDERQKGLKQVEEWQKYGRHTSSVVRNDVTSYQQKLSHVEQRLEQLLRDNMELKELCVCLADELKRATSSSAVPVQSRMNDKRSVS